MDLLDRVRRTVGRHGLAAAETRVIAAVSGGSDSVALACLLQDLQSANELHFVGIAHFNHQLRPAADDEETFCRALASRVATPFISERGDVAADARRERRSVEDAARRARHAFFECARRNLGADVVATGHTRDDQAETFLLRLVRGAGLRGLASMHPRRGAIIRPLLDTRRADLRVYLAERGVPFVYDESNDDLTIPRNRVRAELIPFLERFNPAIVEALAGEADIAREMWTWTETMTSSMAPQLCRPPDGADRVWRIDANLLGRIPLALARHIVHDALTQASGGQTVGLEHVDSLLELSRLASGSFAAPGQYVKREGPDVVLHSRPDDRSGRWSPEPQANKFRYSLSIPGETSVKEAGCVVSAEEAAPGQVAILRNGSVATIRHDAKREPFSVRSRRPGDSFRPLGMGGAKKLQDFFVDRKVARHLRDRVPLVVDRDDRIVWVAGHTIDEEFRVTDPAEAVIILRLKVLGGLA